MTTKAEPKLEQTTLSWKKRSLEEEPALENAKKPRYYFRLESESSHTSVSSDTETVYSLQDKETDYVKDTSDTDTTEEYEVEIEYDVASLSSGEEGSSSSSEGIIMAAAAAAIYEGSYSTLEDAWITDGEDSDNSSLDESIGRTDFWTCIKCKSQNNNPLFRYCEKCFQDRKEILPPRPKPHKKKLKEEPPVKLDALRSCLSGLSHDSGIGSSQECPPLDLDQIVVPKHLHTNLSEIKDKSSICSDTLTTTTTTTTTTDAETSTITTISEKNIKENEEIFDSTPSTSKSDADIRTITRKRQASESSLSDYEVNNTQTKRQKRNLEMCKKYVNDIKNIKKDDGGDKDENVKDNNNEENVHPASKEMCIVCNNAVKDSIFLHGRIGHMSCCYKCAMRTWKTIKRCPVCNRKVNNVVKVFAS